MVTLDAFYVDLLVPAGPQDLSDSACIIPVGLIAHGRERILDLPGFHADHLKARSLKPVG